jgi:hypothetical protein
MPEDEEQEYCIIPAFDRDNAFLHHAGRDRIGVMWTGTSGGHECVSLNLKLDDPHFVDLLPT